MRIKKMIQTALVLMLACAVSPVTAEEVFQKQVPPKKIQMDTDYDGKIDRVETYDDAGEIARIETDTNQDGIIDEWMVFENGKPLKKEKDTNADGKPDVWIDY